MIGQPQRRAHIRLEDQNQVIELIQLLSSHEDQFTIEDRTGQHRVNAKSVIGVMYTMLDFPGEQHLVNDSRSGVFPPCVARFLVEN